jgi:AraC-like DNA-binding protein
MHRAITHQGRPPRIVTHAERQRFNRSAEHYLRKCYKTNSAARASEFAAELGMTPQHASLLASQLFGKPLLDYLREKQLTYAVWLLRILPQEITIEEIALRSAFGTLRTFHRCFVNAYGTTPGASRNLKK